MSSGANEKKPAASSRSAATSAAAAEEKRTTANPWAWRRSQKSEWAVEEEEARSSKGIGEGEAGIGGATREVLGAIEGDVAPESP